METSDQGFRRDFHRLTLDLYKKKPFFPNTNLENTYQNTLINPTPYVEMVILYDPKFFKSYENYFNLLYGFERLYKGAEAGVLPVERFPLVAVALLDQTLRYDAKLLPAKCHISNVALLDQTLRYDAELLPV